MGLADVRLRLAAEEERYLQGTFNGYPHDVAPSAFVSAGLDIEEQQFVSILALFVLTCFDAGATFDFINLDSHNVDLRAINGPLYKTNELLCGVESTLGLEFKTITLVS